MNVRSVFTHYASTLYVAFALGACAGSASVNGELNGDDAPEALFDDALSEHELARRQCRQDADCVAPAAPCEQCWDGSYVCPEAACVRGRCAVRIPQCPPADPCALVRCAAGTECVAGQCVPTSDVACGGFAGIPCPGAGTCEDDPRDTCDPSAGGADCGGLCSCAAALPCSAGERFDARPSVCACVPKRSTPCGDNTCGAGEFCCNASCGVCAPLGGACTQQVCESQI